MPEGVDVNITDIAIIRALNTPGGAVSDWRDEVGRRVLAHAIAVSPVNNPQNARHRGSAVGLYKRSWSSSPLGSNGHTVRVKVVNSAPHAQVVEYGRLPSFAWQRFSSTKWNGQIRSVPFTRGRAGDGILSYAVDQTRFEMGF